jgi:diguanylate cyclase (GGDEF)-like protein/PAS domain S-box-containing protein
MRFASFQRRSIKATVTLFTLAVFVISLVGLSLYASHQLRADMKQELSKQQRSALLLLSEFVNQSLTTRLQALEKAAQRITPAMMADPAALQADLRQHVVLEGLFNAGLLVKNHEGTAIAENSFFPGRLGTSYKDRDHIQMALQQNRSSVGQLLTGRISKKTGFGMSAPIRDAQGQAIGVLTGYIDLSQPNFLDIIGQQQYGQTGGYLLIDPAKRRIIEATDKSRTLEQLPAPGVNLVIDAFLAGAEDTRVGRSARGVEVMASNKIVPLTGWMLAVVLPTDEGFAPIRAMHWRMALTTLLLTLAATGLTWWLLRRQLHPLLDTVQVLAAQVKSPQTMAPLPVPRQDEIGLLISSFNALLANIEQQQRLLTSQQAMVVRAEAVAHLGSWQWDLVTNKIFWSDELFRIFQLAPAATAPPFEDQARLFPASDMQRLREAVNRAMTERTPYELELNALRPDGSRRVCMARGQIELNDQQQVVMLYGSFQDVTEAKQAQLQQKLAAKVFAHAYEGITITDAEGTILDVNNSFTRITGYARDEVLGQNPRLLKSGRQDAAFYEDLWQQLLSTGHWRGELWNRRKSGEIYPELLNISAVRDAQGVTRQYVGLFSDITVRKAMEDQVHQLAFFDALTALPNRRLLSDRLGQALLANQRSRRYGALMFLDLDNFKPLNDTHGHAVGDLLLTEVARRLTACVRQTDTVARIGGDEFVVMLSELDQDGNFSKAQASAVAEKIRASLAEPYAFTLGLAAHSSHAVEHHCSSSIGVVLMVPDSADPEALLQQADAAMYQAKEQGRNRVVFSP